MKDVEGKNGQRRFGFHRPGPLLTSLPPPDTRLIVPKGCSTVHRPIVIKLGLAKIRASLWSSVP
jgi:hypothetical protein